MDDLWHDDDGSIKGVRIPNHDEEPSEAVIEWLAKQVSDIPSFDFDGDGSGVILFCGSMQADATGGEWVTIKPGKVVIYSLPECANRVPPVDDKYLSRYLQWKVG